MAKEITDKKLKELYPNDREHVAYVKYMLTENLSPEDKINNLLWNKHALHIHLTELIHRYIAYGSLEGIMERELKHREAEIRLAQADLVWMEERLIELTTAKRLNFKKYEEAEKPERTTILKNRQQFITFFDALKDSGVLPPQAEQKAFSFFLNQVMGYHTAKMEQLFSEYHNDDNLKKKRDDAKAVIEALEKTIESLKKVLLTKGNYQ